MKITELRIGNIIRHNVTSDGATESGFCEPNEDVISSDDMNLFLITDQLEDAEPIELTSEWLIKLGFDVVGDFWNLKEEPMEFRILFLSGVYYFQWGRRIETKIQYVHELQNLYFALTKTELVLSAVGEKI